MGWRDTLLCSIFALSLSGGQVLFKWAALWNNRLEGPPIGRLIRNYPLMGALAWYGLTAILWFYILTRIPLSSAYAFSILGSAMVPILAWLIFREPLNWQMAAGFAIMFGGFVIVMRARG